MEQIKYILHELSLITEGKKVRWLMMFLEPRAGVIISYRFDRLGYLLFGGVWPALRILFYPVFWFLRFLSCRHEINYKADIGCGLQVWHPTLGVVVNGDAVIGKNCQLYGGNSIGVRRAIKPGDLTLGDDVVLGINSCVLGPARIGNRVKVGAGAVVVSDFEDDCIVVGVPAVLKQKNERQKPLESS